MSDYVLTVEHEGWTEVVLNHPQTRNSITGPLGEQLADAIVAVAANEASKVMLLRGAEGAFCSGLNLSAFNEEPPPSWLSQFGLIWRRTHTAMYEYKKPIVYALEKYAINGGAALALAADLLVVGDDSLITRTRKTFMG